MADIQAVGKNKRNKEQGYDFRAIDDFYDALQPALVKNKVVIYPTILEHTRETKPTKSGGILMTTLTKVRFRIATEDGSYIEADALGEGADSGDKSANKAAAGALKYLFMQVFCVRVSGGGDDSEHQHHEYAAPKPAEPPADPFKSKFLKRLREMGLYASALAMFRHFNSVGPNEQLEELPEAFCPKTKADFDSMLIDIRNFAVNPPKGTTPTNEPPHISKRELADVDNMPPAEDLMDAEGNRLIRGWILSSQIKPTRKAGCTRYEIVIGQDMNGSQGLMLSTLEKTLFDIALTLAGKRVEAAYLLAGKYCNLVSIKESHEIR
jgi:hypothetical protein